MMDIIAGWDWELISSGLILLFLLMISAFFSGSETALTAASRVRMHSLEKDGERRATLVSKLLENPERLLGGILLGNNLVNNITAILSAAVLTKIFGQAGAVYAAITVTVLVLVFAEVLPKTYAITKPNEAAIKVARPINFIVTLLAPIVSLVQMIVNAVLRMVGVTSDASPWTALDEIRGAVDLHHMEGGVAKSARDRMIGALELGDLTVEEIMLHRKNLSMVDADLPPAQILVEVLDSGHTRVPLWTNDPDNVIGVLHAKDMLNAMSKAGGDISKIDVTKIMREPWFVPETTGAVKQLRAFQKARGHFALVVDEYGALMGVITLEDIIEEIVGDIQDEFDDEVDGLQTLKGGSIIVNGDVSIRDLNRARDWGLPDDEAVTIAGLVIHEAQTIPDEGRVFSFHGYRFEILARERNQITKLKISQTF